MKILNVRSQTAKKPDATRKIFKKKCKVLFSGVYK